MRLSRVHIHNFRSIADLTLSLDPKCRILVGINETGKTNILSALHLLSPQSVPAPTDLREPRPGDSPDDASFVRFIFRLDSDDRNSLYENVARKIISLDRDRPALELSGELLTLRQFCETRTEGLYQVNVRTQQKSCSAWRITSTATVLPGWKKPSTSAPPSIALSLGKGQPVPLNEVSLLLSLIHI